MHTKLKEKIVTYDALRGIASICILFSHMKYLADATNSFWHTFYTVFMSKCAIATTFFFLCSGFFLDYTWKDLSFGKFVKAKLKRLYPIAFIVFILALLVDLVMTGENEAGGDVVKGSALWYVNIAANLFMFKSLIPDERVFYSFHGPSWYISVLFFFFLITYPMVRRLHGTEAEKWKKRIAWICCGAYAVELVVCILVQMFEIPNLYLCYVNPWFRIFGEGLAGVLLCRYMPQIQERIRKIPLIGLEIAAIVLFLADILLRNVIQLTIYPAWIQIIPMGLLLIAFRKGNGSVSRMLKTKPIQFLGVISFELYMTHAFVYEGLPVIAGIVNKSIREWLVIHAGTRFIITFVLCIIFAWIVNQCMKLLNKKFISKI